MPRFALALILSLGGSAFAQGDLQIIRATYGDGNSVRDVTSTVASQVQNRSTLRIQALPDRLGGDPAPGAVKTLWVQYRQNGQDGEISVQDGAWIMLPVTGRYNPGQGGRRGNQNQLVILSAQYGADPKWVDVKSILDSRIQSNTLSTPVTNKSLGGDPMMGKQKALRVSYAWQGRQYDISVPEDGILSIPATVSTGYTPGSNTRYGISQLVILSAQYGAAGQPNSKDQAARNDRFADVKPVLDARIQNNQLQVLVDNASLGGYDPAPANRKTLRVNYQWRGQNYTAAAEEGQVLVIPDASVAGSPQNTGGGFFSGIMAPPTGLRIIAATYGSTKKTADVTKLLDSKIQNNSLQLTANNQTMGGDPDAGADKTLRIIYEINGLRYQVVIGEDRPVRIP